MIIMIKAMTLYFILPLVGLLIFGEIAFPQPRPPMVAMDAFAYIDWMWMKWTMLGCTFLWLAYECDIDYGITEE